MSYAKQIRSVKDYIKLPFVFNHWYVAGLSSEFTEEPVARTLLNRSLVFYRTKAGEVVAMQNRCLHRSFPLSEGYLEGDDLVCRYHGIRYAPDGQIRRIPCQDQTSKKKLRTYKLKEVGAFVFIWMGEAEEADESTFPEVDFLADPGFRTLLGTVPLEGNYLLLMENLNDLTHFAYLHKDTFSFDDDFFDLPTQVEKTDKGVWCNRIDRNRESALRALPPQYHELAGDKPVERWDGGMCVSPGVFQGYAPTYIGAEDDPERKVFKQHIMHYTTPETEKTSHYWWSVSLDFELENDMYHEMMTAHLGKGFDEDKWAVQKMQQLLDNDQIDFNEMVIAGDQAGLLYRKVMLKWVQAEYGEASAA
ncbi:MAG: aromatic ring-hydroxylating dioxygenase subunit alpha [Pseudomonadota bacterium]